MCNRYGNPPLLESGLTGYYIISTLVLSEAVSCDSVLINSPYFVAKLCKAAVCWDNLAIDGDIYVAIPRYSYSSVTLCGVFIALIAEIICVSGSPNSIIGRGVVVCQRPF